MKLFLSWSGERSQLFAQALRDWLPLPLHYVEPWISNSDIEAGERWANEVAKELETTNFGIICVTRENVSSPWLLFEAGALAKSMQDGRVIPLLLDIEFKDIAGPLVQFQSKKFSKTGLYDIVNSINRSSTTPVAEGRLNSLFEMSWPQLEERVTKIPQLGTPAKNRPQHEILEELVAGVRGLEIRFRDTVEDSQPRLRMRRSRNLEMIVDFAVRDSGAKSGDPLALLIVTSFLKEQFPWIYDLALDYYKEDLENPRSERTFKARRQIINSLNMLRHGPLLDIITDGSKREYMVMRDILRYVEMGNFMKENNPTEVDARQKKTAIDITDKEND